MDTMRKHLKEMREFLESEGFDVEFRREIWEEPRPSGDYIKDKTKMLIGLTTAGAYRAPQLKLWRDDGRRDPRPVPLYSAITYCSASEPFIKRKGIIIAVARLLKEMCLTSKFKEWRKERKVME
ncbi:MAG: hypothetical protein FJY85_07740 [Deltaproteobacteria bacterium]|nr:hypothetical protein [Deltaproteobacteria bacterium]